MSHIRRSPQRVSRNFRSSPNVRDGVTAVAEAPKRVIVSNPPEGDDGALVAAALEGHPEAFGILVERYDRAVYTLCLRTMRDPEEARDCTQEAFFKAFRSLRTFKPQAKFSTWIFSIAYHACLRSPRPPQKNKR